VISLPKFAEKTLFMLCRYSRSVLAFGIFLGIFKVGIGVRVLKYCGIGIGIFSGLLLFSHLCSFPIQPGFPNGQQCLFCSIVWHVCV